MTKKITQLTEKPPPMRQQIEHIVERVDRLSERLRLAGEYKASQPPLTEAGALERCMSALTELVANENPRRATCISTSNAANFYANSSTERILRYLAAKFGVSLIEQRSEPCSRAHLDEIDPDTALQALYNSRPVTS